MDYNEFEKIFNRSIFDDSKSRLIERIADDPHRYCGLFRPTGPTTKIIQNMLQSQEIRFGDAFELIIEKYLEQHGFAIQEKVLLFKNKKPKLKADQLFSLGKKIYLMEQKIRDDHDSSKKTGQVTNFEKKIQVLLNRHPNSDIEGFFYFIDDDFNKNKKYYEEKISLLSIQHNIPLHLCYGADFFNLINKGEIWQEIISHLKEWKTNIPILPEINFDKNSNESFEKIKVLKPAIYKKLLSNQQLDDVLRVLFPEKKTLILLHSHFETIYFREKKKTYGELCTLCKETIDRL